MDPGLDLDRKIAEAVFGHIVTIMNDGTPILQDKICIDGTVLLPNYSQDINAAWEIIEQFCAEERSIRVGYEETLRWFVTIDNIIYSSFLLTPAHAICIAALKFRGIK